jgi:hypothetical protein
MAQSLPTQCLLVYQRPRRVSMATKLAYREIASREYEAYYRSYIIHFFHITRMSDTLTLRIPAQGLARELRAEVAKILQDLAPLVANQIEHQRQDNLNRLVAALTSGVVPREVDLRQAKMQANAIRAILRGAEWLTAAEIGQLGGFSSSNSAAPANRWKNERKLFAVEHDGQDRFPRYALDETYRPLPIMASLLAELGGISAWRIAAWFESTNAWLDGKRARELIATDPALVLAAVQAYRSGGHG